MTTFHLLLNDDEHLDVERAVQCLKELFPSTTVVGDTFERKRQQLAANLTTLAEQGEPIRNPDLFWQIIARSETELGPGVDILMVVNDTIQITGSIITGRISLSSPSPLPPDISSQIEGYLRSFQVGEVVKATPQ